VIEVVELAGVPLESLAQWYGMVVNLELLDGSTVSGVLGAATSDTLFLEGWHSAQGPNDDPFLIALELITRIVIP
jgi:hypothetical protein